jgi:hypothetical protein
MDRAGTQPGDVDVPGAVGGDHPPAPELGRELERVTAGRSRERPGGLALVAGDGDVEVDDRPVDERVAHRPTDDPCLASGERPAGGLGGRRGSQVGGEAHRRNSRGTRGEIPQVTS